MLSSNDRRRKAADSTLCEPGFCRAAGELDTTTAGVVGDRILGVRRDRGGIIMIVGTRRVRGRTWMVTQPTQLPRAQYREPMSIGVLDVAQERDVFLANQAGLLCSVDGGQADVLVVLPRFQERRGQAVVLGVVFEDLEEIRVLSAPVEQLSLCLVVVA